MKYSILAETYEKLEKESGKIKKTEILSELIKKIPTDILPQVILLVSGKIFPSYSEEKTGIANQMMIKAISKSTGISESEINNKLKDLGDLGLVAEDCIKLKKQKTLSQKSLTIENVYENRTDSIQKYYLGRKIWKDMGIQTKTFRYSSKRLAKKIIRIRKKIRKIKRATYK